MPRQMLGLVMVLGLLLAMVPDTMQRPIVHADGPYLGLVLSTANDEEHLLSSGSYVHETTFEKAGRKFRIGSFNGVPVVYVIGLAPLAHVSGTVQIMIDTFDIVGIIDYGSSASVSSKVNLGDVAVLSETAFTSSSTWEEHRSLTNTAKENELPSLKIGDYNIPEAGDNKLARIQFEEYPKYTPYNNNKKTFWYYVDPVWLELAKKLKDVELESCVGKLCADEVPAVKFEVRGSSSDTYVSNVAYAKFLDEYLGVSTVDRKAAATVSAAVANKMNHIVFRAASNKPGVPRDSNVGILARQNNLKVVTKFIELLAPKFKQPLRKN